LSQRIDVPVEGWTDSDVVKPLVREEFQQIRDLAYRTFGLDLKAGKEELVTARLKGIVRTSGFDSFDGYYRHVLGDSTGAALAGMIDALATNHTSFLREPDHFEFLRKEVIPTLASRQSLDIWCAACSTGEEVWTLAFLLNDALPSRTIRVSATDISNKALRFAERAVYPKERCKGVPADWMKRYFVAEPPAFRVCPRIRSQATFRRINLVKPYSGQRLFPFIFCRNVMIYFDAKTQEQVVGGLSACLEPGGYLFVGHAESLNRIDHSLDYIRPAVYRKPDNREDKWTKSS
jgi:chemotaxis protein methyltransferase CheR